MGLKRYRRQLMSSRSKSPVELVDVTAAAGGREGNGGSHGQIPGPYHMVSLRTGAIIPSMAASTVLQAVS